ILAKYGAPTAEAIVESALNSAEKLEKFAFSDIVLSLKSSDVSTVIAANRLLAAKCDYPLHIGVTEAGTGSAAYIKSAIGIGSLLYDGIGDTIRVSLSENINNEIKAANDILRALNLKGGIRIISCPTCGRTKINLISLAKQLEKRLKTIKTEKTIKVALMGCAVNGPGEASEADIGAAGGVGEALIFKKGVPCFKIDEDKIVDTLVSEVKKLCKNNAAQ
ncbi:MAG: flavodoxin-dependent (E)-4-hydroxy-3-methylbut-2-enyl-diphosphate synthase, partial [Clostridia bacterium]